MKRALCTLAAVSFLVSPAAGQVSPPSGAVSDTQAVLINSPGFVISQPGSYRVARNLSSASTVSNLITVNASNVTIDLGGHLLSGGGRGVDIGGAVSNVVVRNGTFTGQADNAIEGPSTGAGNLLIEDVVARDLNGGLFCFSTPNMIIRDVIVSNTAGAGIAVGDGSILERVTMSDIGGNGMNVQEFVQVRNVTMRNIGGIGIRSDGRLHAESVLIESTGSEGIVGASTAFIRDCHVRNAGRFAPPTRSV
ncbi:MAG: right-handed parallel beta-helix repeat-containing protein, partial [Planctomycetota bacterium]